MNNCYTNFNVQINMTRTIRESENQEGKKDLHPIFPLTIYTRERAISKRIDMYIEFEEDILAYLDYKDLDSFSNAIRQGARAEKLLPEHYLSQDGRFYVTLHGLQKFVRNAGRNNTKNLVPLLEALVEAIGSYLEKLRTYWIDRII